MTKSNPLQENNDVPERISRRWVLGAVAGAAALSGVGAAWYVHQPKDHSTRQLDEFWGAEFARPEGGMLRMSSLRGRPLLLNFWATWCPPCIEELPLLSGFYQENSAKGWQVLGLAIDQVDAVQRFLVKTPVAFPVAMAGMTGVELTRSLGNLVGGLPFTVVFGADGTVAHRKMGRISPDDLRSWVGGT